jgi:hypothetical protein
MKGIMNVWIKELQAEDIQNIFQMSSYLLIPWSRVLLEKLTGLQVFKKFLAFLGTRKFITAYTITRHLYLS